MRLGSKRHQVQTRTLSRTHSHTYMIKRGSASAAGEGEGREKATFGDLRRSGGGGGKLQQRFIAGGREEKCVRSSEEPRRGLDVGDDRDDGVETGHVAQKVLSLSFAARVVLDEFEVDLSGQSAITSSAVGLTMALHV